ncbi:MAG: DUF3137 domain-containing protein [Bacteroidales bacterium]|nr:DUF3137 domain-containing protein [Bacteroidales bacterium]
MKSEEELLAFFNSNLQSKLEPLEQFRIEKVEMLKKYIYRAFFCSILIALVALSKVAILILISFFPMFLFLGLAYRTFNEMSSHLTKQFKNKILPELLRFLFDDHEYIANQKIAKSVLVKSMLFPSYIANVNGEDFMQFKIGETQIMFSEIDVKVNNEDVFFHGIFLSASFNKYFTSKTFVLSQRATSASQKIKRLLFNNFSKIKLEDNEFNKVFFVLSSDQVEARYILTPSLMQRILNYRRKIKRNISISFVENRLYCMVPSNINLFEPALFEPFDFEFVMRNYNPLKLFTDIVDDLNLNVRIWSKQ